MHYGLDPGNGGTKIAHLDRTGQPVAIQDARGNKFLRSCIYIDPVSGKTLVGEDAFEQSFVDPVNACSQIKLRLGSDERILAGKTAVELTAIQLKEAVRLAERQTGETVDAVVLVVPAYFGDKEIKRLLKSAEIAGIRVIRVVCEPVAAAFAYGQLRQSSKRGEKIMVFDVGSSTFDVAICELDGDAVNVVAIDGIPRVGGDAIDDILRGCILAKVEKQTGKAAGQLLSDPLFKLDLAMRTTAAKVALGVQDKVQILLTADGRPLPITIERAEFEAAILPLINLALECCDRALKAAGLTPQDLSSLYLVGGPCRSPFVQDKVACHFGLVPRAEIDPETAVAQGAALIAESEMKAQGVQSRIGVDVIPQPDAFLREATHHDIGVAVEDRSSGTKRLVNAVVVPKNTPVPARIPPALFRLESPDQTEVIIEVLQGPNRADLKDCAVIGRLVLSNLPVEAARSPRIQVTFMFDKNTCATVIGRDLIGGQESTATVDIPK